MRDYTIYEGVLSCSVAYSYAVYDGPLLDVGTVVSSFIKSRIKPLSTIDQLTTLAQLWIQHCDSMELDLGVNIEPGERFTRSAALSLARHDLQRYARSAQTFFIELTATTSQEMHHMPAQKEQRTVVTRCPLSECLQINRTPHSLAMSV